MAKRQLQNNNCKTTIAKRGGLQHDDWNTTIANNNCKATIATQQLKNDNGKTTIATQQLQNDKCKTKIAKPHEELVATTTKIKVISPMGLL